VIDTTAKGPADRIALRMSVVVMILAATAIPVELRPHGYNPLGYGFQASDVVANVVGYVPLGMVLGELGVIRAVLIAALMSTLAEASQFAMVFRDPSLVDIAANVAGAGLGTAVTAVWRVRLSGLPIDRPKAVNAAVLAVLLVLAVWLTAGDALNARGSTLPGILEAHWRLDELVGRVAKDSSGHALDGLFSNPPKRIRGARDGAVMFDGATDFIHVGHSSAFRLVGSMTISAWIYSTSYPVDDAAIVSNLLGDHDLGFQLDTTIDNGPRSIGFKLGDACQNSMARYGATPLLLDTWYYVAGVYDAAAETMDVYLNGELDNGVLRGSVGSMARSSRGNLCIGRRSDRKGYEFAGAIDDVRIYSRALTQAEIAQDMGVTAADGRVGRRTGERNLARGREEGRTVTPRECTWSSEYEDRRLPVAVAVLGMLVAVALVGLVPSASPLLWLIVSPFSGLLCFYVASPTLPRLNLWSFPLIALTGAASVVVSVRRGRVN
jgi:VanZ family protein